MPGVPHAVGLPVGHVHVEAMHDAPDAHTVPHVLQFAGSLVRSTHTPPHAVLPTGQPVQEPPTHTSLELHVLLQVPQCKASVLVSVQVPGTPPHTVGNPVGQVHVPATHAAPVGHARPHPLQFFASVDRSTHAPAHAVSPGAHVHAPALHTWLGVQTLPHAPQLS